VKARRLLGQGLEEEQIAEALQVPVELWRDVQSACGMRPLSLEDELQCVVAITDAAAMGSSRQRLGQADQDSTRAIVGETGRLQG
jgi:hypothetical protein